jgi:DNA-binding transcriptional LysR family regulator
LIQRKRHGAARAEECRLMAFCRFTPRQLEAFVAVHEAQGFGAAAQRLSLTPSAISQLVAELEDAVGFRLFDRHTRKVSLTAAGQDFLSAADAVLSQMAEAARVAAHLRRRAAGQVSVAAPQVLAATLLPAVIEHLAAVQPAITVQVRDTPVERLPEAVARLEVDLAVGPDLAVDDAVQRVPLFDSPWVLWCAPGHALAQQAQVRWCDLRKHRLVAAGRDHERSVPSMALLQPAAERIVPDEVVDLVTTALGLAARGLAVTLAPAYVAGLAQSMGLAMRRVTDPEATRQVCLYRPARQGGSEAARAFAAHLAGWVQASGNTAFTCPVPEAAK